MIITESLPQLHLRLSIFFLALTTTLPFTVIFIVLLQNGFKVKMIHGVLFLVFVISTYPTLYFNKVWVICTLHLRERHRFTFGAYFFMHTSSVKIINTASHTGHSAKIIESIFVLESLCSTFFSHLGHFILSFSLRTQHIKLNSYVENYTTTH